MLTECTPEGQNGNICVCADHGNGVGMTQSGTGVRIDTEEKILY